MKKITFTLMILEATIFSIKSQTDSTFKPKELRSADIYESDINSKFQPDSTKDIKLTYGLEINRFTSNSGFKPGIEFSFFVKGSDSRRSLEVAGFFDTETKNIAGLSLNHKYMLLKKRSGRSSSFEPYLFYCLTYRSTTVNGPLTIYPEIARQLGVGKSKVSSLEHHIGLGLKMNLKNSIYFHCDLGYGCYLGSIKKPTIPDEETGIYSGGNGWGIFSRFGFGIEL